LKDLLGLEGKLLRLERTLPRFGQDCSLRGNLVRGNSPRGNLTRGSLTRRKPALLGKLPRLETYLAWKEPTSPRKKLPHLETQGRLIRSRATSLRESSLREAHLEGTCLEGRKLVSRKLASRKFASRKLTLRKLTLRKLARLEGKLPRVEEPHLEEVCPKEAYLTSRKATRHEATSPGRKLARLEEACLEGNLASRPTSP